VIYLAVVVSMHIKDVGSINGKHSFEDFRIAAAESGESLSLAAANRVWDQQVLLFLTSEFDKLGLRVGEAESGSKHW
jgi:hypothetical protein